MSSTVMKNVQRAIRVCTVGMDNVEYEAFLRELAKWAQTEADVWKDLDDMARHFFLRSNSI